MSLFKIELGEKVKDSVTGFKGTVTARAEYLTGCRQYAVTAKTVGNKIAESGWYDEDRLLDSVKKKTKKKNVGGPQSMSAPLK